MSLITSKICCTTKGARPMEGSSRSMTSGLAIMARPMASICCSPPESVPPNWFCLSKSLGKRSNTLERSSLIPALSFLWKAPSSRFSRTDMFWRIWRPSGTSTTPPLTISKGFLPTMDSPLKRTSPATGFMTPMIVFMVVDLPAPLAPMSVTIFPSGTERLTPFSALMFP